jgi:hypothetical protein
MIGFCGFSCFVMPGRCGLPFSHLSPPSPLPEKEGGSLLFLGGFWRKTKITVMKNTV